MPSHTITSGFPLRCSQHHTHTHTHTHASTHTRTQAHTHTHTQAHILARKHTYSHTHTLSLTHTHTLSLSLSRTHARTRMHTHTHTHTHTHVALSLHSINVCTKARLYSGCGCVKDYSIINNNKPATALTRVLRLLTGRETNTRVDGLLMHTVFANTYPLSLCTGPHHLHPVSTA